MNPWPEARNSALAYLSNTTAVLYIIDKLDWIEGIASVQPAISSSSVRLLIVPNEPDSITSIRELTKSISAALTGTSKWQPVQVGPCWSIQRSHAGVIIDITTSLPTSQPTELAL